MTTADLRDGIDAARSLGNRATDAAAAALFSLRGRHLVLIDLLSIAISVIVSLELRHDGLVGPAVVAMYLPALAVTLVVRPVVNTWFELYRRLWQHASVPELWQIVGAATIGSLISFALAVVLAVIAPPSAHLPLSFWVLEFVISLAGIGGIRFGIRAISDLGTRAVVDGTTVSLTPALLYGAGRAGSTTARSALREPAAGVLPSGCIDEHGTKRGSTVAGLPVFGGLDRLGEAIRRTGARMILITLPN